MELDFSLHWVVWLENHRKGNYLKMDPGGIAKSFTVCPNYLFNMADISLRRISVYFLCIDISKLCKSQMLYLILWVHFAGKLFSLITSKDLENVSIHSHYQPNIGRCFYLSLRKLDSGNISRSPNIIKFPSIESMAISNISSSLYIYDQGYYLRADFRNSYGFSNNIQHLI